jgi:ABC-type lipoprotein export system ATPase subunit
VLVKDSGSEAQFDGSVFDDNGVVTRTMVCVPLNDLHEVIGCVQLVNRADGGVYDDEDLQFCEQMAALAAMTIDEKGLKVNLKEDKEVLAVLRDVTKEFPSGGEVLKVLKGINLEIYKNEFVIILGESGCGKTTMMNIVGGMDFLTDGKLEIEGKDFSHPTDAELTRFRREYVGFIFQAYNLMPNLSAYENIEFIAELSDNPMDSMEALKLVGLGEKAESMPTALSGGQMQRISIARALVKNPKIILADEPTAALDYDTSIKVLSVIEKISRENNTTILMVTHNPEIAKMANRVVKLRDGKISSIRVNLKPLKATDLVW